MVQLGRLQSEADFVVVYFFPQAGRLAVRVKRSASATSCQACQTARQGGRHHGQPGVGNHRVCERAQPKLRRAVRFDAPHQRMGRAAQRQHRAHDVYRECQRASSPHVPRVDVWKHAAEVLTLFPQSGEAAAAETPASTTAQAPAQVASSNAQAAAQAAAHPPFPPDTAPDGSGCRGGSARSCCC